MIIACEQCRTRFNLDENLLKQDGSKVRCSKCSHVFVAYPPETLQEKEDAGIAAVAPVSEPEEPGLEEELDLEPEPETAADEPEATP